MPICTGKKGEMKMKNYRLFSKIVILVSSCLIVLTALNYVTGILNSALPGSSHVICIVAFCLAVFAVTVMEKDRLGKQKER